MLALLVSASSAGPAAEEVRIDSGSDVPGKRETELCAGRGLHCMASAGTSGTLAISKWSGLMAPYESSSA